MSTNAHRDPFEASGSSPGPRADIYLTTAEVARLLQVSEKTVYRWAAKDPSLPMLKVAGSVRFPKDRLHRWLRTHEQGQGRPRRMDHQMLSPAKSASAQSIGQE